MIAALNKDFVALELNLTERDWPAELPCLWNYKLYHSVNPISKLGFTAIACVTPDGKTVLGRAKAAAAENWKESEHYHGEKMLELLNRVSAAWTQSTASKP